MAIRKSKKTIQQEVRNLNAIELMDFVLDKYHTSEKRNLSSLNQCFQFMPIHDIRNHPEIATVRSHFNDIRKLLQKHLSDSETLYFPAMKKQADGSYDPAFLKNKVHSVQEEISQLFLKIQNLTNHYTPPADASGWMKLCYALLHDLETDIYSHLFVEESILPLRLGA